MRSQEQSRSIKLPDGYPLGYVIGRGGTEIKRIQYRYGVRMHVDSAERRVTVPGAPGGVNATMKELTESFEAFTVKQAGELVRLRAAFDACAHHWRFAPLPETAKSEDVNLTVFDHVLQRVERKARAIVNNRILNGNQWLASINPHDSTSISVFFRPLRQCGQQEENKVSLVVGTTFFQLIQPELAMRSLSWSEPQSNCHGEAFRSSWFNVFDRNTCHESIRLLVEALEARIRMESLPVTHVMMVFVRNVHRRYRCTLSYQLVNGKWWYARGHLQNVKAFVDVVSTNEVSLRISVSSRDASSGQLLTAAKKCLDFETPRLDAFDDCAFDSSVAMGAGSPVDLVLQHAFVVAKYHVTYRGLRFSVGYADRTKMKIRLRCRSIACDPTDSCAKACVVLRV